MHQPSGCPSCTEPLEEGDRFCGVCGYDLSAPPPDPADRPTMAVAPPPAAAAGRGTAGPGSGPGGTHGADGPSPAPGWGSVASAAPTLVDETAGWTPASEPPPGAPDAGYGPVRHEGVPQQGPYGATAHGTGSGAHGSPYDGPYGGPAGPADGQHRPTRYDGPQDPYGVAAGHPGGPEGPAEPYAPVSGGAGDPRPYGGSTGTQDPYGGAPHGGTAGASAAEPAPAAPAADPGGTGGAADGQGRTCIACRAGHVDPDGYCENCGHAQPRERDHVEEELGSVAAVSDRGLRHHRNEDSFAVSATALPDGSAATVAIVCDGVSSASRPDDASAAAAAAAAETLLDALPRGVHPQEAMHTAILAAAQAVTSLAPQVAGAQNAPACTLVGAVISSGLLTVGWVGDSRAYWVPDDRAALPHRLTEDDSWAAQMVAAGLMGEAEAYADVRAHAITGWLGADAYELEPHTKTFRPDHPGVVVVCTDGLWNYAESAGEMAAAVPADAAVHPLRSAQVLVGHALDGGGHDNVTVAVVPFALPRSPESAPAAAPQA